MRIQNLETLDALVEHALTASRIPGGAVAIVTEGKTVFAQGYGDRDREAELPFTSDTLYPIASTTKALNATLLGMLVDEGLLAWDRPVQDYLPQFRLKDPYQSLQVTVRDLLVMRTGLPRHDWVWMEQPTSRAELVLRLRHLDLTAGLRERHQYNNLTVAIAGHVAEVVTGRTWEELLRERILEPLQMKRTVCARPAAGNVTQSYHENRRREVVRSQCLNGEVTAPSGGAVYSTVEDMARWVRFNLERGQAGGRALIQPQTLEEIRSAQIVIPPDPTTRKPRARYAMGWTLDDYRGRVRISHGGYLHDVNSEILLFPQDGLGIVTCTNFGPPHMALPLAESIYDHLAGRVPMQTLERALARYEQEIAATQQLKMTASRVAYTRPSHAVEDYAGIYEHPGYGKIEIQHQGGELTFRRNDLRLPLEHWHFDAWVGKDVDRFGIHEPHAFDCTSRLLFESDADGRIAAVSIPLEPAVAPIRFEKLPLGGT